MRSFILTFYCVVTLPINTTTMHLIVVKGMLSDVGWALVFSLSGLSALLCLFVFGYVFVNGWE